MKKTNYDHCIVNTNTDNLECLNCGDTKPFNLPMDVDEVSFHIKKFQRRHKLCKPKEAE